MPLYLLLMHGRKTVEEDMEDWGSDGPILGPLDWASVTYTNHIRVARAGWGREDGQDILLVDRMIHYNGVFYGDWEFITEDCQMFREFPENKKRIEPFEWEKAELSDELFKKYCHLTSPLDVQRLDKLGMREELEKRNEVYTWILTYEDHYGAADIDVFDSEEAGKTALREALKESLADLAPNDSARMLALLEQDKLGDVQQYLDDQQRYVHIHLFKKKVTR